LREARRFGSSPLSEEKACRKLAKAGCDPESLRLLVLHVNSTSPDPGERPRRLAELADFARAIGPRAAEDYFHAIRETMALVELTDPRVLEFARSVDPHTAEWYFWAIWGTKEVRDLTAQRVLDAVDFFRAIGDPATVEYFFAIRETKAAEKLTDPRVLAFARSIGSDAAVEYFGACWETGAIDSLTSPRVLSLAPWLKGDTGKEYFQSVRETKAVEELTDERVAGFVRRIDNRVAEDYFRAVRMTRAARDLTSDPVTVFAEVIGTSCARQYFRVLANTKEVEALTCERLLRTSAVIRAIGSDAALDYFLAAATRSVFPDPPPSPSKGEASTDSSVPVLTLLDIPQYDRYRPMALLGVSALFWWGVWGSGVLTLATTAGRLALLAGLGAWVACLWGTHLLTGMIAERASDEFVERRRRLLNEHGIRWHDCLSGDRHCPKCWSPSRAHRDDRFDYGRFCRCPAC
jgi:hypothetical protein